MSTLKVTVLYFSAWKASKLNQQQENEIDNDKNEINGDKANLIAKSELRIFLQDFYSLGITEKLDIKCFCLQQKLETSIHLFLIAFII